MFELCLWGKVAVVTGSGKGIGYAVAFALAAEGASVVINDLTLASAEAAAREIGQHTGSRTFPVAADISKLADIKALFSTVAQAFGRIDLLVNNAGSAAFGTFLEMPDADWEQDIALKYLGYVRCIREAAPHMIRAGGGSIVSIIGVGGLQASIGYTAGGSINAALRLVTKGVAIEFARHHIRVNAINPGFIDTGRLDRMFKERARINGTSPEEEKKRLEATLPQGHMGRPEDVANAILFLLSDKASYISGAELLVDGGYLTSI